MRFLLILMISLLVHNECLAEEDYVALVERLTKEYSKQLKKEYGLDLIGSGGGMMKDVEFILLYYEVAKSVDDQCARKVLVDCVEKLLYKINSNKKLRPYLHNHPFTAQNLDFSISFRKSNGDYPERAYVAFVTSAKGLVISPHYDHKQKKYFGDNPELYEETYTHIRGKR